MNPNKIRWIRDTVTRQGLQITETSNGHWVVRDAEGHPLTIVHRDDNTEEAWRNALWRLFRLGWIIKPPGW